MLLRLKDPREPYIALYRALYWLHLGRVWFLIIWTCLKRVCFSYWSAFLFSEVGVLSTKYQVLGDYQVPSTCGNMQAHARMALAM